MVAGNYVEVEYRRYSLVIKLVHIVRAWRVSAKDDKGRGFLHCNLSSKLYTSMCKYYYTP